MTKAGAAQRLLAVQQVSSAGADRIGSVEMGIK